AAAIAAAPGPGTGAPVLVGAIRDDDARPVRAGGDGGVERGDGRDVRVALVHDWLTGMRGGERVLESLCLLFPQADIFTLVHVRGSVSATIESRRITTSFVQRLPGAATAYRRYLPLFPSAIEQADLDGYDLVISSSHCVAKSV